MMDQLHVALLFGLLALPLRFFWYWILTERTPSPLLANKMLLSTAGGSWLSAYCIRDGGYGDGTSQHLHNAFGSISTAACSYCSLGGTYTRADSLTEFCHLWKNTLLLHRGWASLWSLWFWRLCLCANLQPYSIDEGERFERPAWLEVIQLLLKELLLQAMVDHRDACRKNRWVSWPIQQQRHQGNGRLQPWRLEHRLLFVVLRSITYRLRLEWHHLKAKEHQSLQHFTDIIGCTDSDHIDSSIVVFDGWLFNTRIAT